MGGAALGLVQVWTCHTHPLKLLPGRGTQPFHSHSRVRILPWYLADRKMQLLSHRLLYARAGDGLWEQLCGLWRGRQSQLTIDRTRDQAQTLFTQTASNSYSRVRGECWHSPFICEPP